MKLVTNPNSGLKFIIFLDLSDHIKMIEVDEDLLPRMNLLLSPKSDEKERHLKIRKVNCNTSKSSKIDKKVSECNFNI